MSIFNDEEEDNMSLRGEILCLFSLQLILLHVRIQSSALGVNLKYAEGKFMPLI